MPSRQLLFIRVLLATVPVGCQRALHGLSSPDDSTSSIARNSSCAFQVRSKKTVCSREELDVSSGHVRAATRSATLSEASGTASNYSHRFCELLGSPPFVAVVARWDEDVAWAHRLPMPALIYEHAKPGALYNVPINRGSETSSYIQFIVDHYACMPPWVLFLHAHGRTASSGASHAATRHHPTDPHNVAALLDVAALGKGFVGLGHFSDEDWLKPKSLHRAARAFSAPSKPGAHHAAFVPTEEGKRGCECKTLRRIFPGASCEKPWSWNVGAEFWASSHRTSAHSVIFWRRAMKVIMSGKESPRFGHSGSLANEAGYCFESVWHALLGEPLYGFKPSFKYIEDLPLVSFQSRCDESQRAISSHLKGCLPVSKRVRFEALSSDGDAT